MQQELVEYAVRGGPAASYTGLWLFGYPATEVVQVAVGVVTLIYTVVQLYFFLRKKLNGG